MTGQEEGMEKLRPSDAQAKDEMREIELKKKNRFGTKEIQADNEKMANADLEKLDTGLEAKGKTKKIL